MKGGGKGAVTMAVSGVWADCQGEERVGRTKCMLQTATTVKAPADRASNSQLMKPLLLVLFPRMRRVAYEPRTETRIEATVTPGLAVHGT